VCRLARSNWGHFRRSQDLPIDLSVKSIPLSVEFKSKLESRVVLLNTGSARLARDLLQQVLKKWARREKDMVDCVDQLPGNAIRAAKAISDQDLEGLATELNLFWKLKRAIAGSSTQPEHVTRLFAHLNDECLAQSLCGAGGGGFAAVILKEGVTFERLQAKVNDWNALNDAAGPVVHVKRITVCTRGLSVD